MKFPSPTKRSRRGRHVCGSTYISIIQDLQRSSQEQVSPTWKKLLFAISITSKMQQSPLMWSRVEQNQNLLRSTACVCLLVCLSKEILPTSPLDQKSTYAASMPVKRLNLSDPCGAVLKKNISQRICGKEASLLCPKTNSLRPLKYPEAAHFPLYVEQSNFQNIRTSLHVCVGVSKKEASLLYLKTMSLCYLKYPKLKSTVRMWSRANF